MRNNVHPHADSLSGIVLFIITTAVNFVSVQNEPSSSLVVRWYITWYGYTYIHYYIISCGSTVSWASYTLKMVLVASVYYTHEKIISHNTTTTTGGGGKRENYGILCRESTVVSLFIYDCASNEIYSYCTPAGPFRFNARATPKVRLKTS